MCWLVSPISQVSAAKLWPKICVAGRGASGDNAIACHWHPIFENLNFARDFTHTVRKTHTSSARSAEYQTLARKHKQKIDLAKQMSFARQMWGPPGMRAKLDAKTLRDKPFRQ